MLFIEFLIPISQKIIFLIKEIKSFWRFDP